MDKLDFGVLEGPAYLESLFFRSSLVEVKEKMHKVKSFWFVARGTSCIPENPFWGFL